MAGMTVEPHWELTFDADGDVDAAQRERLVRGIEREKITDLVVFSHGWNNDRSTAVRLYDGFFTPFAGILGRAPAVRLGYVGVIWPSMRFTDEPIPDLPRSTAAPATPPDGRLDPATRRALADVFPDREQTLDRIADLLAERPEESAAFEEFAGLVRELVEPPAGSVTARAGFRTDGEAEEDGPPAMLSEDALTVCRTFTAALAELPGTTVSPAPPTLAAGPDTTTVGPEAERAAFLGRGLKRLWHGAHELLRQASYYTMKRRAGTVGERGLGPLLGALGDARPDTRVHLVGHSFGARLVAYALRGLPRDARNVKSVTLLQGAFSHYAFAGRLPHASDRGGALHGAQRRVDGPLVSCFSAHDSALGVLYPLASRVARDSSSRQTESDRNAASDRNTESARNAASARDAEDSATALLSRDPRWGAIGFDGIQAVDDCRRLTLAEALRGPFPADGCVSVDAGSVVDDDDPVVGAHNDICHEELARIVCAAGRIGHR
ncbi:serine-threonine protein kinase [Streptomyces sp. LX-29]|uniref:serine-threonine protein kinase n=1 Tax=Streptomyces sp. LX-29 TaxID=2900152 RepID=UPI00240D90A9|nr:serine-threonine protein kinase [Streptomyces sp. LX-29]WFB10325.1 serine-threonine protein kinase [Streptomyces sp. LX-29]